jgi:hypothetical protein
MAVSPQRQRHLPHCQTGRACRARGTEEELTTGQPVRCSAGRPSTRSGAQPRRAWPLAARPSAGVESFRLEAGEIAAGAARIAIEAGGIAPPGWGESGLRARGRASRQPAHGAPLDAPVSRPEMPGRRLGRAVRWLGQAARLAGTPARRLGSSLGDRLFRANDAEAFLWGWQTNRTSLGLGRRYR